MSRGHIRRLVPAVWWTRMVRTRMRSQTDELRFRSDVACWATWRQRRHLCVNLLALLGSWFLVAALYPTRVSRQTLAFFAALWSVAFILTLVSAAEEWMWRRRAMGEDGSSS